MVEKLLLLCRHIEPWLKFFRYNEVCVPGYNFNNGGFRGGTGHFTQVVWKASMVLGIGLAEGTKNGMKCAYIVARYKPAGNQAGQYQQNVQKGSFDRSYCATLSHWKRKFLTEREGAEAIDSPVSEYALNEKTGFGDEILEQ